MNMTNFFQLNYVSENIFCNNLFGWELPELSMYWYSNMNLQRNSILISDASEIELPFHKTTSESLESDYETESDDEMETEEGLVPHGKPIFNKRAITVPNLIPARG